MALQENAECLTRTSSILNRLGAAALAEFVDTYAARDGEAAWPGAVFTADGWLDDADAFERAATVRFLLRGEASSSFLVLSRATRFHSRPGGAWPRACSSPSTRRRSTCSRATHRVRSTVLFRSAALFYTFLTRAAPSPPPPVPTGRLPAQLTGATQSAIPRSLAAGAGWADGVRALWGKHAGALVWLRKTRRTLQLYRTLSHASGQRTFEDLRSTGVREIARPGVAAGYISRRDVFVSPDFSRARPPGVRPSFEGFVYLAMLAQDVPLVTSLLEAGAPVAGRAEGALTAVHRAAYYGFQAPMFRVLLRLAPDLSPALLLDAAGCAAEQGLGCHLSMLLCRLHGARRVPRGECALSGAEATQLAFRAAASSALDCAAGLGPPCERCASGDGPHAAGASAAAVGAVFGLYRRVFPPFFSSVSFSHTSTFVQHERAPPRARRERLLARALRRVGVIIRRAGWGARASIVRRVRRLGRGGPAGALRRLPRRRVLRSRVPKGWVAGAPRSLQKEGRVKTPAGGRRSEAEAGEEDEEATGPPRVMRETY